MTYNSSNIKIWITNQLGESLITNFTTNNSGGMTSNQFTNELKRGNITITEKCHDVVDESSDVDEEIYPRSRSCCQCQEDQESKGPQDEVRE